MRLDAGAYREVFRERSFRLFWSGFAFSVLGDAMTRVALTWLVYDTTGSGHAVAWLMVCFSGPILLGGLAAGWLLDRFDRRRVMIVDSLVRGGAVASIPLLAALDRLEIWHVYIVAGIYGLLMMISLAGGPAMIPGLVPPERRATANALEMLGFTLGGVVGPPLTGLLIGSIGAANVVVIDALSYVAFAIALLRIGPSGREAPTTGAGERHSVMDALRLLASNPILRATTLMFMLFNLGSGFVYVALPLFADRTLAGGAQLYGALLGVLAIGEVLAAVLAGTLVLTRSLGSLICRAQALSGLALLALVVRPSIVTAGLALLAYGAFSSPLTIWAQTLRMQIIPPGLRGRAFALLRTMMQGGTPIGSAIAGPLLPVAGIPALIGIGALIVAAPGIAGSRVAELREAGAPEPARPDAFEPPAALSEEPAQTT